MAIADVNRLLLQLPRAQRNASVSPDGQWIAYESEESGAVETYVRPYPAVDNGRWQISTHGGRLPRWAPDGRTLYFIAGMTLMSVSAGTGASWVASNPTPVLSHPDLMIESTFGALYDVSRDGRRFVLVKTVSSPQVNEGARLLVIQNWQEEMKRAAR